MVFLREQVWSGQGKDLKLHLDEVRLVSYAASAPKPVSAQGQLPPQADPFVWVTGDPTPHPYSLTCPTRQASQSRSRGGGGYVPETTNFAVPPPPPTSSLVQTIEVSAMSKCTARTTLHRYGCLELSDSNAMSSWWTQSVSWTSARMTGRMATAPASPWRPRRRIPTVCSS